MCLITRLKRTSCSRLIKTGLNNNRLVKTGLNNILLLYEYLLSPTIILRILTTYYLFNSFINLAIVISCPRRYKDVIISLHWTNSPRGPPENACFKNEGSAANAPKNTRICSQRRIVWFFVSFNWSFLLHVVILTFICVCDWSKHPANPDESP